MTVFLFLFCLALPHSALAAPEYFGIPAKSISYADEVLNPEGKIDVSAFKSAMENRDQTVYADARFGSGFTGPLLEVTIYNNSRKPIPVDTAFLNFTIVTQDYTRHVLKNPWLKAPLSHEIPADSIATFKPRLAGLRIERKDIRMITCAFNPNDPRIILLPLPEIQ